MWQLMAEGQPTLFPNGSIDESVPRRTWELSDMDIAMYTFRNWDWRTYPGLFPKVQDGSGLRSGHLVRFIPCHSTHHVSACPALCLRSGTGATAMHPVFDFCLSTPT
jgi:hypothetical protein